MSIHSTTFAFLWLKRVEDHTTKFLICIIGTSLLSARVWSFMFYHLKYWIACTCFNNKLLRNI